jgi:hypothetical protein
VEVKSESDAITLYEVLSARPALAKRGFSCARPWQAADAGARRRGLPVGATRAL